MKWLLIYAMLNTHGAFDTGIIRVEDLRECNTAANILKQQSKHIGVYVFTHKCVHSGN